MWDRAGEQHRGRPGAELSLDLTPELRKKGSTSITARRMELDMLTCRWRKEKAKRKINGKESHQTHIHNVLKLGNISGELWGCYPHHYKWDPLLRTWGSWRPSPAFLIQWDSGPGGLSATTCLEGTPGHGCGFGDPRPVPGTEEGLGTSWPQTPIYQQGSARDSLGSCCPKKPHQES